MNETEKEMTLENIVSLTQGQLKFALATELKDRGYEPASHKGFLYAKGEVPVLLVAHLDTVHKQPVAHICYSPDGTLMMSPEGIGGDDRCGVYMILEIIKQSRCHVLFTEDEETGCNGARDFANSKIRPEVNYIIEIDRRGGNDAVFYQCANLEFNELVCAFGFSEESGSFSDISVIAPRLGVAAVNISAGYHNEHTRYEYINLTEVQHNIRRIGELVQTPTEQYAYIGRRRTYYGQMTLADARLWGLHEGSQGSTTKKLLMPLSNDVILTMGDYESNHVDEYFIDRSGNVHRYLPDLDAAVCSDGVTAYYSGGDSVVFDSKKAIPIQILTLEDAIELLGA